MRCDAMRFDSMRSIDRSIHHQETATRGNNYSTSSTVPTHDDKEGQKAREKDTRRKKKKMRSFVPVKRPQTTTAQVAFTMHFGRSEPPPGPAALLLLLARRSTRPTDRPTEGTIAGKIHGAPNNPEPRQARRGNQGAAETNERVKASPAGTFRFVSTAAFATKRAALSPHSTAAAAPVIDAVKEASLVLESFPRALLLLELARRTIEKETLAGSSIENDVRQRPKDIHQASSRCCEINL